MGAQLALGVDQHVRRTGEALQQYAEKILTIYYLQYDVPIQAPGTRRHTSQIDCPPQDLHIIVDFL